MTIYNVHIYREMKLRFDGVEADTPEAAAAIAHDKPTGDADDIDDCDGEDFAALVDVAGDEEFEQSRTIDFDPERQRKAASKLLAALEAILPFAENEGHSLYECWRRDRDPQVKKYSDACASAIENAHATVAQAKAAGIAPATTDIDNLIRELLRRQRQVAIIWCIADVKPLRPDLTDEQAWEVLEECHDKHDCEWGFTWTLIEEVAQELFGDAPETDDASGGGHEPR